MLGEPAEKGPRPFAGGSSIIYAHEFETKILKHPRAPMERGGLTSGGSSMLDSFIGIDN